VYTLWEFGFFVRFNDDMPFLILRLLWRGVDRGIDMEKMFGVKSRAFSCDCDVMSSYWRCNSG
jgi:hypothetical protein